MINKTENHKYIYEPFSIRDTNVFKGVAILLMLIHHLFYVQTGKYDDIHLGNHYLINEFAIFARVCVTLFVFMSGYGLMIQTERKGGVGKLTDFYIHRFRKLFFNYWFIWALFVPISYFVFGMTFEKAYQDNVFCHLLADVFGVHYLFFNTTYCYNPTWWFYSCIILLYLFFPFMYKLIKRNPLVLILVTFAVSFLPISCLGVIRFYIVAFALGMWAVQYQVPHLGLSAVIFLIFILGGYCVCRNFNSYPLMIDCIITLMAYIIYRSISVPEYIKSVFAFLGRHSMNIFLFHTFIFHFWFQDFIYISRNPLIIFLMLLSICIPISMLLELIKKYTIYRV